MRLVAHNSGGTTTSTEEPFTTLAGTPRCPAPPRQTSPPVKRRYTRRSIPKTRPPPIALNSGRRLPTARPYSLGKGTSVARHPRSPGDQGPRARHDLPLPSSPTTASGRPRAHPIRLSPPTPTPKHPPPVPTSSSAQKQHQPHHPKPILDAAADCRAYEQVTPPFKDGAFITLTPGISQSGVQAFSVPARS